MASARAKMGALRRKIGKRQKTANVASGIFSTLGTVAAFGAGQAKKAETAWGEYEAGYKAIDDAAKVPERPKIGKGYFKGPEGEVRIGKRMYDRSKIQKAGSFLGRDTATALFAGKEGEGIRKQYLERTAPGREIPSMTVPGGKTTEVSQIPQDPFSYQNMLNNTASVGSAQDPYTDKQRQPYLENTQKSAYMTSFLSRNKHDSGGGETGFLTNWFGQDENEYNGR